MNKCATFVALALLLSGCVNKTEITETSPKTTDASTQERRHYEPIYHHVLFEFDSTEPAHYATLLTKLAPHIHHLKLNPTHRVLLQGAGDDEGSFNYNYNLGLERANYIKDLLIKMGVQESQIKISSVSKANSGLKPYARTVHLVY